MGRPSKILTVLGDSKRRCQLILVHGMAEEGVEDGVAENVEVRSPPPHNTYRAEGGAVESANASKLLDNSGTDSEQDPYPPTFDPAHVLIRIKQPGKSTRD